ncbi:MAG: hypothetical protein LBQ48_01710 [Oscillospiraceae bacterium]|jgi:hypothetical protein|nr:hypothetical protein [Oscillospiraceae bacterium]
MIRGVNKQIIEVAETNSRYFERALLFVRPEFASSDSDRLYSEAKRYLSAAGQPPSVAPKRARRQFKKKRRFLFKVVVYGGIGLLLAGIAALILYLL